MLVIGTATLYPRIHLGQLELPEPADPVRWETARLDPAINRVLRHAEMAGHFVNGNPGLNIWFGPEQAVTMMSVFLAQNKRGSARIGKITERLALVSPCPSMADRPQRPLRDGLGAVDRLELQHARLQVGR